MAKYREKVLLLVVLNAALGACSRGTPGSPSSSEPQPMPFRDLTMYRDTTQRIYFYNFSPTGAEEREGLQNILGGRGFSPNGLPLQVLLKSAAHRKPDGQVPPPKLGNAQDQFQVYGNLPSPPERSDGVKEGLDAGVAYSLLDVTLCKDGAHQNAERMQVLPIKVDALKGHCDTDSNVKNFARISTVNCLGCHSGVVAGTVVAGLGNNQIDQVSVGADLKDLKEALDSHDPKEHSRLGPIDIPSPEALKRGLQRTLIGLKLNAIESEVLENYFNYNDIVVSPVFKTANVRGDNLGPYWVWKYFSRLKIATASTPTLVTFSREEDSALDKDTFQNGNLFLPTVDPTPWWLLRYKDTVYWYGEPNRLAKDFSFNFTQSHRGLDLNHEQHVRDVEKALLFARSTTSPRYPKELNWDRVEMGRKLFHEKEIELADTTATCSSCHGTYTHIDSGFKWSVDYPGPLTKRYNFVDPTYAKLAAYLQEKLGPTLQTLGQKYLDAFGPKWISNFIPGFYVSNDGVGILPPPLVGVWASAPYFHNGSVPTLFEVLRPQRRSPYWSRSTDPTAYDFQKAGLVYDESKEFDERYLNNEALPNSADKRGPQYERMAAWSREHFFDPRALQFRRTYYTDLPGKNNGGHSFAVTWTDDEINSVIEFLKSVSGPGVNPVHESDFRRIDTN